MKPIISIILPSYFRPELLNFGLLSLSKQMMPCPYEIIVLNDGIDTDGTKEVCDKYKLNIKYIFTGQRNTPTPKWRVPGIVFNEGVKLSQGKYIILSSPEIFHIDYKNLLNLITPLIKNPKALTIPEGKYDKESVFLNHLKNRKDFSKIDISLYDKNGTPLDTKLPFCMGLTKEQFNAIGGFDPAYFEGYCFDDTDFVDRLIKNGCTYYQTSAKIIHLWNEKENRIGLINKKELWIKNHKLYLKKSKSKKIKETPIKQKEISKIEEKIISTSTTISEEKKIDYQNKRRGYSGIMEISIIIPSFKRAELLHYGLLSLSKQKTESRYEVIVLNDGVQDDTEKICYLYKDKLNIRCIFTGQRNYPEPKWRIPGFAINIGVKLALGKNIIILCPEIYLLQDCLQEIIDSINDNPKRIVITDGKDDQDENFLNHVKLKSNDKILLDLYDDSKMTLLNTKFPFFMGINKSDYIDIGGYDEDFIGNCWDDQDLMDRLTQNGGVYYKLNYKIVHLYHPRLHYEDAKIKEMWNYNKNLYDKKFGEIKRNINKNWGNLITETNIRPPNELEKCFLRIYEKNIWNEKESKSGKGSNLVNTASVRPKVIKLINSLKIDSILDLPCGDFNWMKEIIEQLNLKKYLGGDIIRPMILDNQLKYSGIPILSEPEFVYMDATEDVPPKVDLILCRDGLVHLSYANIIKALKNFVESGSTYLLMTTFTNTNRVFEDITDGKWRAINFQLPPFSLPVPEKIIIEGNIEENMKYSDKSLGLWRLSTIKSLLEPTPVIEESVKIDQEIDERMESDLTVATSIPKNLSIIIDNTKPKKLKVAHIHPWWDSAAVGIMHTKMMNKYTDILVRHIVAGTTCLKHDIDLILSKDDDEIKRVLKESDILHFNTFWYDDPQLVYKFPWENYLKDKKIIFHMHGGSICFNYKKLEEISKVAKIFTCSPLIPKIMPFTTWVPNTIPIYETPYMPKKRASKIPLRFLFMVNHDHNKGRAEVEWLIQKLNKTYGYNISFESWLHKYSLSVALEKRKDFDINIDNITQGFIGMTGWESLCQEQVCLARLSPIVLENYTKLGEGEPPPIVNVSGIDELAKNIIDLSANIDRVLYLQKQGRKWMERYYNPQKLCKFWEKRYIEELK